MLAQLANISFASGRPLCDLSAAALGEQPAANAPPLAMMGFASLYPSYDAPARGEKESTDAKPLTGRTLGWVEHLRNPSRLHLWR